MHRGQAKTRSPQRHRRHREEPGNGITACQDWALDFRVSGVASRLWPLDCSCRRCRTTSYSTTPAATDTFNDGTFPNIGIETRKSHFFFTKSWTPLPSAPSTIAQFIL